MANVESAPHSVDPNARTLPSDTGGSSPPPARDPLIGSNLGHFRIDAMLGRGGMGAVYSAWDTSLDRPVALKTLLADSPTSRMRFLREARAQAQLRHPNVVPIHFLYAFVDLLPHGGMWQIPRVLVVLAWAFGFLLALGRGKRTLHDHIVRTREVFAFGLTEK